MRVCGWQAERHRVPGRPAETMQTRQFSEFLHEVVGRHNLEKRIQGVLPAESEYGLMHLFFVRGTAILDNIRMKVEGQGIHG